MSYPIESERAITFAMQWSLLNIGAALGGLITLIQTLQNGNAEAVGTGTYVAFVVIVCGRFYPRSRAWSDTDHVQSALCPVHSWSDLKTYTAKMVLPS